MTFLTRSGSKPQSQSEFRSHSRDANTVAYYMLVCQLGTPHIFLVENSKYSQSECTSLSHEKGADLRFPLGAAFLGTVPRPWHQL